MLIGIPRAIHTPQRHRYRLAENRRDLQLRRRHAPSLDIEVLEAAIFASNQASIDLFSRHGFERWG